MQQARELLGKVAADDQGSDALKVEESSAGLLGRIGVRHREHELGRDRNEATTQLRRLLIPIARSAPAATIPEADEPRKVAADLQARATALDRQIQAAKAGRALAIKRLAVGMRLSKRWASILCTRLRSFKRWALR